MQLKAPFTDVKIKTEDQGFYQGFNVPIAVVSKLSVCLLVVWAAVWPANANDALSLMNTAALQKFNTFYIYSVAFFTLFALTLAIFPGCGSRKL